VEDQALGHGTRVRRSSTPGSATWLEARGGRDVACHSACAVRQVSARPRDRLRRRKHSDCDGAPPIQRNRIVKRHDPCGGTRVGYDIGATRVYSRAGSSAVIDRNGPGTGHDIDETRVNSRAGSSAVIDRNGPSARG
jgi:hypothetical protein